MRIPPTYPCGKSTIRSRFGLGGNSVIIINPYRREIKFLLQMPGDSNPRVLPFSIHS